MDSYLKKLQEAITAATKGMTSDELVRHAPGKWSVAEVLEHLSLTYTGTTKGFRRCLEAGKPLAGPLTLKQRVAIAAVTGAGYFPNGRKAPKQTEPTGAPSEKVVAEIGPQIVAMDEAIARCEARHGKRARLLDHPVLGPLTAQQWRKFHWVHGKHHVKQIQRLRAGT
jgi:hypothetical protein